MFARLAPALASSGEESLSVRLQLAQPVVLGQRQLAEGDKLPEEPGDVARRDGAERSPRLGEQVLEEADDVAWQLARQDEKRGEAGCEAEEHRQPGRGA